MNDFVDNRESTRSIDWLLHRIKYLIRECEEYNIDYSEYVDKTDLESVINVLECCISNYLEGRI